jgi:hypothetical protein
VTAENLHKLKEALGTRHGRSISYAS